MVLVEVSCARSRSRRAHHVSCTCQIWLVAIQKRRRLPAQLTGARVRPSGMTNAIDCSKMSHASCYATEDGQPFDAPESSSATGLAAARPTTPPEAAVDREVATYDCVNDCVSSVGVAVLVSGATASLGCLMVPPACPIFIGTSVGTILGACEVACEDLESAS